MRGFATIGGAALDLSADATVIAPSWLPSDFDLQRRWATGAVVLGAPVLPGPEEEPIVRAGAAGDHVRLRRLAASASERGLRPGYVSRRLARASAAS